MGHRDRGRSPRDHPERDQPDVRDTVEGVRPDAGRHPVRDLLRVDSPVQKVRSRQLWFIITGQVITGASEETGSTPESLTLPP